MHVISCFHNKYNHSKSFFYYFFWLVKETFFVHSFHEEPVREEREGDKVDALEAEEASVLFRSSRAVQRLGGKVAGCAGQAGDYGEGTDC